MDYALHVATTVVIYAGLVASLNLLIGHAGILSFAHAAFFGIGAYATAMLTVYASWHWAPAMLMAIVSSAAIALLIGAPTLRLGGDYFILALFGFQLIVVTLILNLEEVTNGPFGIRGIQRPGIAGSTLRSGWPMLLAATFVVGIVFLIAQRIATSSFGAMLHAIRDDETVAAALGIPVARTRLTIFVISAGLAGLVGAVSAFYFRFVDTSSFATHIMILLLAMAFVGGTRSLWGAAIGPAVLVMFPELFRFIGPIGIDVSRVQEALYGLLLVLLMLFRPQGLVGSGFRGHSR